MQPQATVVTGASTGIGRAIAEALLAQGRTVVDIDYQRPDWSHPRLASFEADLTRADATRDATIAEAGLPGYEATSWFGLFAPAWSRPPAPRWD